MQNSDSDAVYQAAMAKWKYELGEDIQIDEGDDWISEADGGVWIKAWLWIPDEEREDHTQENAQAGSHSRDSREATMHVLGKGRLSRKGQKPCRR
jgi:hypothetical protein